MRPPSPAPLYFVAAALLALGGPARAADAPPHPYADLSPPPFSSTTAAAAAVPSPSLSHPAPAVAAPNHARPLSPATAARLAERMPKFSPPPPLPAIPSTLASSPLLAGATSDTPATDFRAPELPRNTIVRLPNYIVREERPPAFKEREILTPKGRLALAFKRYPGLHFGSLPFFSNAGVALAMLEEDHRLERKAEMAELASLLVDPTDRAKATTEVEKTFLRSGQSGYRGMAPK